MQVIFQDDIGMEAEISIFLQPNEAIEKKQLYTKKQLQNIIEPFLMR